MDANRKKTVLVCCGTGCLANNSLEIYTGLKQRVLAAKLAVAVEPVLKSTGCNGFCEKGPIVKILPDDVSYYKVQPADVEEIFTASILNNEVIDRLLYLNITTGKRVKSQKDNEFYKQQMKLALRNIGEIDPANIDDYIARDGYQGLKKALLEMTPLAVIAEVKASGLRGRGGAGFPTGQKWQQCASYDSFPKYAVCNGDEGDPGAFMDRSIMEGDPHTVIEGMLIGGYAIKAETGYIYIRDEYSLAIRNMALAIEKAKGRGFLGRNILGSGFNFDLHIVRGGGAFVCGESTALMASIEGNVGEPRAKYVRSVEKGLWGQPTVLNNVETWANIPLILSNGSQAFQSIGTENSTGTKVFSLVGKVKNTGLVEVPMGVTLRHLIFDIGGGVIGNKKFKAVQSGGPSGGCIPESLLDLRVDFDTLTAAGSMMGSGGMIVMDERTCMVDVARYYVNFLAEESCGKCVPCREGLTRMREILNDICRGEGRPGDIELLEEICAMTGEAALCGLGKSAPNPVVSTIEHFKDEYLAHIVDKRCPAGICKDLTAYYINQSSCIGCGLCAKNCPAGAISGQLKTPHTLDMKLCIKCGNCIDSCKFDAVQVG
ncbi:MAG TPA: NADH-quinone oxidoreductase subunit NuoF [Methylomusa anaerophila]|uniref:NADP-reducing hydrogenase subunit HndC n=1 Tax=Methylomusa anaerophila TaxID=1930071 RepID=A0A348ALV4_9FIRM|nr:NADH-quinone oxidoreductase subunit NuoF [Methylomusa anaerophila]BBB92052.1 NADP-reducing hydrogenase subunit HndC [Methylomusa anaerophila]HML87936.1 NADH-quinone oxidoreductase subunit NuoF [Methylomusa anaerophila]